MTDAEALADRVLAGDVRVHELEEHADAATAAAARRRMLERETGVDLAEIGAFTFGAEAATSNIENLIGGAQIPMGIAGPVPVDGGAAAGDYYLPMATTEGALVASVNRGCAAIREAGGAQARVLQQGMTRAPLFRVDDVVEAAALVEWVQEHRADLKAAAETTTSHGELVAVDPYVAGTNVYLRCTFDTKDAMGMNMATIATPEIAALVEAETTATLVATSGNLCVDKKPAAINAVEGRGRTVVADVTVPADVVGEVCKTTPAAVAEVNRRKNLVGSARAASLGFNAQAANVIGAVFLATGQDEAHVVEGSNTITTARVADGALHLSVSLASLLVGTVGGGTTLPTQSEALEVIGVAGGGEPPGEHADAFAEVLATGVLAGELSLLSALASRNLATAHEQLGR